MNFELQNDESNGKNGYFFEEYRTLNWSDYVRIFRRRWWIVLLCFTVVVAPTAYYTFTTSPIFQASTTIMVHDAGGMQRVLFDQGTYMGRTSAINDQVYLLISRSISELVVGELMKSEVKDSLTILSSGFVPAVYTLRSRLSVEQVKNTNYFVEISVKGSTPFEAAYVANTVAKVYQEQDQQLSQGEIREVVNFLDEQLKKKEKDLGISEEMLKNYQERENIASLSRDAEGTVNQLVQFESLYNSALTDIQVYEKRLEYMNLQLGRQKENLKVNIAQISKPLILKLREELAEIERNAAVLIAQDVSEEYQDLKNLRERQNSIKKRLIDETQTLIVSGLMPNDPLTNAQELVGRVIEAETEIHTLKARADALKSVVETYSQKLEKLPEKSLQLARLERYKKLDESLYYMMKEKYEESRISMAGQIGKVRIIDRAVEPGSPVSPRKERNLMLGTLFGLGLGLAITILLEFMDKSIRSIEDIERLGFPLMGAIPHIPSKMVGLLPIKADKDNLSLEPKTQLITTTKPKSHISESYRTLRTNLQFSETAKRIRCILVSSPGPGEGKSTTVANLGAIMANMGFKTLLIDSDLRRPVLHRTFNLDRSKGLTNLLVSDSSGTNLFQSTSIENLYVLTSGMLPPNPSELLGSQKMKVLLDDLKKHFEIVIMDSPPIIAVTDAQVLAQTADGVLLVVKSGQSQTEALKRAEVLIKNVKARLLGVVLNDMRRHQMYGSYYYYYDNNYYYGEKEDGKSRRKRKRKSRKNKAEQLVT